MPETVHRWDAKQAQKRIEKGNKVFMEPESNRSISEKMPKRVEMLFMKVNGKSRLRQNYQNLGIALSVRR